jgi:hypothetical protein
MPKATSICNSIVNLMYRAVAWANVADNAATSPATSVRISLHSASPTAASGLQNENESTYTNYLRVTQNRSTVDWSAPAGGQLSNANLLQFPQCGATGQTVTHVGTGTGASGATPIWHYGALSASLAIANGITPQFNIGALVIQES